MPKIDNSLLHNLEAIHTGLRVDSAVAAVVAAAVTKFTVTGGNIVLLGFFGEIVTNIQAVATTIIVTHTPNVGTASIIAILAGATNISGFAAGRMCYLPAAFGGVLTWTPTAYGLLDQGPRYILRPGALSVAASAAPNGTIRYSMFYLPVDHGAYVTGS